MYTCSTTSSKPSSKKIKNNNNKKEKLLLSIESQESYKMEKKLRELFIS